MCVSVVRHFIHTYYLFVPDKTQGAYSETRHCRFLHQYSQFIIYRVFLEYMAPLRGTSVRRNNERFPCTRGPLDASSLIYGPFFILEGE
jgi:hypothetical protein